MPAACRRSTKVLLGAGTGVRNDPRWPGEASHQPFALPSAQLKGAIYLPTPPHPTPFARVSSSVPPRLNLAASTKRITHKLAPQLQTVGPGVLLESTG